MKNIKVILSAAVLALSACSPNTRKTDTAVQSDTSATKTVTQPESKALFAKMQIKSTIKAGDSVLLKFTVYNPADSTRKFCKWHTPFEPLMSKYLEIKAENGEEAAYEGPMAKRIMPPPASSYIKVDAKDSLSATVDVLKAYAIKNPGKYTIKYAGQNMSGLMVTDSISFVYVK